MFEVYDGGDGRDGMWAGGVRKIGAQREYETSHELV